LVSLSQSKTHYETHLTSHLRFSSRLDRLLWFSAWLSRPSRPMPKACTCMSHLGIATRPTTSLVLDSRIAWLSMTWCAMATL